ncbi:MAG: hypothetical protein LAT64_04555 [Phycisphaerales bacterium]|nr:PH domain-containing protein [Planctomycetota bacterium]MCH8508024.1 hypothetical protein [Phycisphaerales bacterium]
MPLPHHLQPILDRELDEGEVVRWADTPRYHALRRKLIGNVVTVGIMLVVFTAMWFFLGFFASIDPERSRVDVYVPIGIGIVFLLLGIVGPILVFRDTRHAADNTVYAVTDRRVIILRRKRNGSIREDDYRRDRIAHIARDEHPDGTGSLTLDIADASGRNRHQLAGIADPLAVERLIRTDD